MKRILAVLLTITMMIGSMGTVLALETNVSKTGYTVVVSENFEDASNLISTYVDGTLTAYTPTQSSIYGFGKSFKGGRGQMYPARYGSYEMNKNYADTPNLYIETQLDMQLNTDYQNATSSQSIYTSDVVADINNISEQFYMLDNANGVYANDFMRIYTNEETKTFGVVAWETKDAGTRKAIDLGVPYVKGDSYRFRIVVQVTDANGNATRKLTGIYINGVNALSQPLYLINRTGVYGGLKWYNANSNLYDNYAIYTYQSADGTSPVVNKDKLVFLIRANADSQETAITNAKTVYENEAATQADVDRAIRNIEQMGIETLWSEDFEDSSNYTKFYGLSGASVGAEATNYYKQNEVPVIYDMNSVYRYGTTGISEAFSKVYILSDASDYATNKEDAHTFVETEFDVYVNTVNNTLNYDVMFASDQSAPNEQFLTLRFGKDGKVYLSSKDTRRSSASASAYELCDFDYAKNNSFRVRVVMQITDGTDTTCEKVTAVYINGENVLSAPRYFMSHNTGKFAYFNRIKISGWHMGLDNITVKKYQANDGISPIVNKGKLVETIRKYDAQNSYYDSELAAAKAAYQNENSDKQAVDDALNGLLDGITGKNVIDTEFTWEDISNGQAIGGVTKDLNLSNSFASAELGNLDVIWTSSAPEFIAVNGEVTRPKNNKSVVLLAKIIAGNNADINVTKKFEVTLSGDSENEDLYTFKKINFKNGTHVSAFATANGTVDGVKLLSRGTESATVIVAVYKGSDLYDVEFQTVSPDNADEVVEVTNMGVSLPDNLTDCSVKVFVWDLETVEPVMDLHLHNAENDIVTQSTIYIAGDSTAHTYADNPDVDDDVYDLGQRGWGQVLADSFDAEKVVVNNQAMGGQSADSFYSSLFYKNIKENMRNGDYLLIQFGHNDYKNNDYKVLIDRYKEYLRMYIDDAKAVGATPIIVTSIPRYVLENGSIKTDEQQMIQYVTAAKEVAQEKGVACIDIFTEMVKTLDDMNENDAKAYYLGTANPNVAGGDWTHFNETGAKFFAGEIVRLLGLCEDPSVANLKAYIKK